MKSCLNDPGHMTSMAAMPVYDKNLRKSSSLEPTDLSILVYTVVLIST